MGDKIRDLRIDIIKGLAIFLVVLGHSIQCFKGSVFEQQGLFYNNPVFAFIYSFHMPIFMLLSGYLFYPSLNKYTTKELVIQKLKLALIPSIVWTLMVRISLSLFRGDAFNYGSFVVEVITVLWFLWAIFYCSIGVLIGKKIFKDSVVFHMLILSCLLVLPNVIGKDVHAFMYPYFVIGYYVRKHDCKINNLNRKNIILVLLSYLLLMVFWNKDRYIYTTGLTVYKSHNILGTLGNDVYRWIVGILGSIIVIWIVDKIYHKYKGYDFHVVAFVGQNSLGIYIISRYIFVYVVSKINIFISLNEFTYSLICIPLSMIIIAVELLIITIMSRYKIISVMLLGSQMKRINFSKVTFKKQISENV